jgi:hypothetical protein
VSARDEKAMRDSVAPTPQTSEELRAYIDGLVDGEHSYGTCVYAMSLAATAAFNFVASRMGVTGFQASCADLDILKRTRGYKHGFSIVDNSKLLYPQCWTEEYFPTPGQMLAKNTATLRPVVYALLQDNPDAHESVRAHWDRIGRWMTQHEIAVASVKDGFRDIRMPAPLTMRDVNGGAS